jgi:hypothetical protein
MAAVKVKTGPIAADDPARDVPPEKWFNLMLARRSAVHVRIPYDCRSLLNYVSEAEEFRMWEQTGHADLQAYIRDGLNVDPELLEWAKLGLASFESGKPVPLATAVEAGKKAAQTMEQAHVLAEQGGDRKSKERNQVDNINLKQGGTSAQYLASRIKRDAPEIAERVMAGEFPTDPSRKELDP